VDIFLGNRTDFSPEKAAKTCSTSVRDASNGMFLTRSLPLHDFVALAFEDDDESALPAVWSSVFPAVAAAAEFVPLCCNSNPDRDRETPASELMLPESIMFLVPGHRVVVVLGLFCGEEQQVEAGGSPAVNAGDDESGGGTPLSVHDHSKCIHRAQCVCVWMKTRGT
jgi:hypothetical protein